MDSGDGSTELADVLVVTVRKSFWASKECEIFPHRLYATELYGYSQNRLNSALTFLRSIMAILVLRPKVLLFGSSHRLVPWFIGLKRRGLLRRVRLVATNQVHFSDDHARYLHRIIVYTRCEAGRHEPGVRDRYEFAPLPADVPMSDEANTTPQDYVFSGGGPGPSRDFTSVIEAVRDLAVRLVIVTFSPESLGYDGDLPSNVQVQWKVPVQEFIEIMAGSLLVVVPLYAEGRAWGHTTVIQALKLGKPVVTTANARLDDYVRDGREGLLVEAGDVDGYRRAIKRLLSDHSMRFRLSQNALEAGRACSYSAFARRIAEICRDVLSEGPVR